MNFSMKYILVGVLLLINCTPTIEDDTQAVRKRFPHSQIHRLSLQDYLVDSSGFIYHVGVHHPSRFRSSQAASVVSQADFIFRVECPSYQAEAK